MPYGNIDIFGYGITTVDDLVIVANFPPPNSKQPVVKKVRQCGGLTASALVAAARLGCGCALSITLGEGELSRFTRDSLVRENLTLLESGSPENEPFHSLIITEEGSGERSILFDGSKSPAPAVGERDYTMLAQAKCLFTDHVYATETLPLAKKARETGKPVVGDFERHAAAVLELIDLTDHVILPLAYAAQLVGETLPEEAVSALLRKSGRSVACVTDSERGCWWGSGEHPETIHHQPSFKCENVVDTTGCGDVFHGAYAASLVQGYDIGERVRRAAAAACLKAGKIGAQAGAPTKAELDAFLAGR
jgi:Sugar kinases, ribokinase family